MRPMTVMISFQDGFGVVAKYAHPVEFGELAAFKPIHMTDIPLLSLGDEVMMGSESHQEKVKLRNDAVGNLANHLSCLMIEHLETLDKFNGYPLEKRTPKPVRNDAQELKAMLEKIMVVAFNLGHPHEMLREIRMVLKEYAEMG